MNGGLIYHVAPIGAGWSVRTGHKLELDSSYADKGTALRHGQELARQSHGQLVIHRQDGSVQAEHWY